jgi:CubicO group peptidase (beta-lactamase class C family)
VGVQQLLKAEEMKKRKGLKMGLLIFTIVLTLGAQRVYAQTLEAQMDSVLQSHLSADGPGAVFLATKNGQVVYRKAFGKANLELNVAMSPEHVFQIGSMTKQFTAVAILMLMEAGKLQVEDDITTYIPTYPTHGQKITIHHLLTHTSGVKDFTSIKAIMEIANRDLTPTELLEFFAAEPMDFAPGEKFKYNNSGYVILGAIIEAVSGETYEDFVEKHIFKRLNMNDSRYGNEREIIKNRAAGYQNKEGLTNKMHISFHIPYASGALMSTVDDMLKWQEGINDNLLLTEETTNKAFATYTSNKGEPLGYGYGWHLKALEGVATREHGGSIFGFKSMGVYVPDKDIYVIGLSNCDCNSPTQLTKDIAALIIKIGN